MTEQLAQEIHFEDDVQRRRFTDTIRRFRQLGPAVQTLVQDCFWPKTTHVRLRDESDRRFDSIVNPLEAALAGRDPGVPGLTAIFEDMHRALEPDASTGARRLYDLVQAVMLNLLDKLFPATEVQMVGAVRNIEDASHEFDEVQYSGRGLIHHLYSTKNPPRHKRARIKDEFEPVLRFVRSVLESDTAEVHFPDDVSEILVSLDGVDRPLRSLGQGVNQVILLAIAATRAKGKILCIEEPEQHLHPVLQRKLLDYLVSLGPDCQFFISTHSPVFLDHPKAAIFSVKLTPSGSQVSSAMNPRLKHELVHHLGFRASDLLQSNCAIWVEGPSDAIYLKHWISEVGSDLREGVDYCFLFYGGKVLGHHTLGDEADPDDDDSVKNTLIHCLKVNRRSYLVMDSDRKKASDEINLTKKSVVDQVDTGDSHRAIWVTDGREIENYLSTTYLEEFLAESVAKERLPQPVHPTDLDFGKRTAYKALNEDDVAKEYTVSKVKYAEWVTANRPHIENAQLRTRVETLVAFIRNASHLTSSISQEQKDVAACENCGHIPKTVRK